MYVQQELREKIINFKLLTFYLKHYLQKQLLRFFFLVLFF